MQYAILSLLIATVSAADATCKDVVGDAGVLSANCVCKASLNCATCLGTAGTDPAAPKDEGLACLTCATDFTATGVPDKTGEFTCAAAAACDKTTDDSTTTLAKIGESCDSTKPDMGCVEGA